MNTAGGTGRAAGHGAWLAMAAMVLSPGCRRAVTAGAAGEGIPAQGKWGGLNVRTAGERNNPKQVVIMLHGWGASGEDLVPLGRPLAAPGRLFVFPEAPLASPGGGRAWWHLDQVQLQAARERGEVRDLRNDVPKGMKEAREKVVDLVAEVQKRTGLPASAVVLGGFSQGAMMAVDAGLAAPQPPGGLVALSGALVAEVEWLPRFKALPRPVPMLISHGRWDPVLPFSMAEALRQRALEANQPVTWLPFDGGHEIPMEVLDALEEFLKQRSAQ